MRTGRTSALRRILGAAALCGFACATPASKAEEPSGPPTVERIQLDETSGHVEEALNGWIARYLGVTSPADRTKALAAYVALASKHAVDADAWLVDAFQRSGPGLRIVAGRRVVVVSATEYVDGLDPARLAALFDAEALAVERVTGVRPPTSKPSKEDPRPRDQFGRFLVFVNPVPEMLAKQAFDSWVATPDEKSRGATLAFAVGGACATTCVRVAANKRVRLLEPAASSVVRDLAARDVADPAVVGAADAYRAKAKERYENDWLPGCLPGEWIPNDEPLAQLFFAGLDLERSAGKDPLDVMHAFFALPRGELNWGGDGRLASSRDLALEAVAASFSVGFVDVLRRAGLMPVGRAFDDMKVRVDAEVQWREGEAQRGSATRWDTGRTDSTKLSAAARAFRAAAQTLGDSIVADEAILEAAEVESKDDVKKARADVKKLGLVGNFEFLGPLPESRPSGDASAASRIMPLAVAAAPGRRPLVLKAPVEVSLKWAEPKDVYDKLVDRTPWDDKRGTSWGSAAVAATRWTKDIGRLVRLRPCRGDWSGVVVLSDGRPFDRFPDGSSLVSGAKGTDVLLASPSRITCAVPWREAATVEADLAAAAGEKDAILALRPWAARRVAAALPVVTDALVKLPDADFVRDVVLLSPYRGGDAATCDAVLAHAKGRPAVLAAYLDVCRGSRDAAVLDRLVAMATAADVTPDVLARIQYVLDGALFRKVVEKGPALAALWERGRKWMTGAAFAEFEEVRDLHDATPCFRVVADASAWGRECLAPTGVNDRRGEGYLALDVPEGTGNLWLAVRWQAVGAGRLSVHGTLTDGRKPRPFSIEVPASSSEKHEWGIDWCELGAVPRGRIVLAVDDPCMPWCKIDAIAVGPKPLE